MRPRILNSRSLCRLLLGLVLTGVLSGPGFGCFVVDDSAQADSAGGGGASAPDPEEDGAAGGDQCQSASDCVLAASTCCECPSFAVLVGQGYDAGCEEVNCEAPAGLCPAVEATCDLGQCVVVCSPIITDKICTFGFERDAFGCLTNVCNAPPMDANAMCVEDVDCVQVPADCCGCGLGGQDQAVPLADEQTTLDALNCPSAPECPGIDVCDAEQVPRCIGGSCALAQEPSGLRDPNEGELLCGTPELSACPTGAQCVLNQLSADAATTLGVGICLAD